MASPGQFRWYCIFDEFMMLFLTTPCKSSNYFLSIWFAFGQVANLLVVRSHYHATHVFKDSTYLCTSLNLILYGVAWVARFYCTKRPPETLGWYCIFNYNLSGYLWQHLSMFYFFYFAIYFFLGNCYPRGEVQERWGRLTKSTVEP